MVHQIRPEADEDVVLVSWENDKWWQFRDARDQLPSKVRDTLLLSHTLSEEAIFKLMFDEELPPLPDDDRQEEPLD